MQHYDSLEGLQLTDAWLTIGTFDGVHLGHQEIIRKMSAGAHAMRAPAVVLTFFPHPAQVLRGVQGPYYLTTPQERAELIGSLGVDVVVTHPFTKDVAARSARDFMGDLHRHLAMHCLCVGHDFALGRGREGNIPALEKMGQALGYVVHVLEPVTIGGQVISSSRIRSALAEGDLETANRLLGRDYRVSGPVVHGDSRGHTIGIPTANLEVWPERILPRPGVYACRAHLGGRNWPAVTNIGYRPTFENRPVLPRVETHLLEFGQDLYGREMELSFVARLRDEQRFPDVQALAAQIQEDIRQARKVL
jgi:riboflavin kinase/FMN adenylyltransferase